MEGEKTMKTLSVCFVILARVLSDVMCAVTAYRYCDMIWGIRYAGYSAPASAALVTAVPFLIGIIACLVLAFVFRKGCITAKQHHLLG